MRHNIELYAHNKAFSLFRRLTHSSTRFSSFAAENLSRKNSLETAWNGWKKLKFIICFPLRCLCVKSYFICRKTYLHSETEAKKLFAKQIYKIDFSLRSFANGFVSPHAGASRNKTYI